MGVFKGGDTSEAIQKTINRKSKRFKSYPYSLSSKKYLRRYQG